MFSFRCHTSAVPLTAELPLHSFQAVILLLFIGVLVLGSLAFLRLLYKHKGRIRKGDANFAKTYGVLFQCYTPAAYFWVRVLWGLCVVLCFDVLRLDLSGCCKCY